MATLNIVVEFASKAKDAAAQVVFLGYDFAAAKDALLAVTATAPRRELYRGGLPYMHRSYQAPARVSNVGVAVPAPAVEPAKPEPAKAKAKPNPSLTVGESAPESRADSASLSLDG